MGIPYSKQINAAFESVTPLVAAAYETLSTVKDISLLLLALEICSTIFLAIILVGIIALLFTVNPDLEKERKALVTPAMKWIASWMVKASGERKSIFGSLVSFFMLIALSVGSYVYYRRKMEDKALEEEMAGNDPDRDKDEDLDAMKKGKDVDALKEGKSKQ